LASNRELIEKLVAARKKYATPSYKVTLGKSANTLRSLRVDIAQLSTYIIGMPDMGKSNLLANLFLENQDHSKILIDPQGKLTNELILPNINDPSRIIYFAPYEQRRRPLGFNPFDLGRTLDEYERDELAGSLRSIFAHLWLDSYRQYPQMAMVIQNSLNLLVQFEGMTFLDMARVLIDKGYRTRLAGQIEDLNLRDFWLKHYSNEMGISTYNKINEFVQIGVVRRSVCQRHSAFYLNQAMEQGKTIIVNLGGLPDNAANVLCALFVSRVLIELKRREPIPTEKLTPFAVFVDEFDRFGGQSFETIISKCRQQKSSVCIAHQHWGQLGRSMQQSVLQCAYLVCFKVDSITAEGMKKEFGGKADLVNVPTHHAWVRTIKKKTGSVPEVDLIRTRKAPDGDPAKARAIKELMWPLGHPAKEVEAEIFASYDIVRRYNVIHEPVEETPAQIQPTRQEDLPRPQVDWPARFRHRPSAVFDGVGERADDQR
jgi:hypothetical protein